MNKIVSGILVFAIFAVFITVPAAAQNEVYLLPQHGNTTQCNTTIVQIWVNGTDIAGAYMNFTYDPACANVTDIKSADFPRDWDWNSTIGGKEIIAGTTSDGLNRTGNYLFANLTIHCLSNGCITGLNFSEGSDLFDQYGLVRPATRTNGTFTCGEICLGNCCNDSECTDPFDTNVSCKECIDAGKYWKPNKDANCFNGPEHERLDLCLDYCPHCCDGKDNDYDGKADFPADPECTCGLGPSETEPLPPIPEAPSIILLGIGLLALILLMRWRRRGEFPSLFLKVQTKYRGRGINLQNLRT